MLGALAATGTTTLHAGDIAVETSSRRGGRAPGGFSDLLRRLAVETKH